MTDDPAIVQRIRELADTHIPSKQIGEQVGLAGSTVRAIARRAGIKLNTIYQHNNQKRKHRPNELLPTDEDVAAKAHQYALSLGIDNTPTSRFGTKEEIEQIFMGIGPISKSAILNERW